MRKTLATLLLALSVGGFLAIPVATPAHAAYYACKTVTYPPKTPWYLCINFLASPNFSRDRPDCYPTTKTVCKYW